MISTKFVVLLVVVAVAAAAPRPDSPPYGPPSYKEPGMPYDFAYAVKDDYTGNDFGHDESSDGNVASGSYYVQLPDGRRQTVKFSADHHDGYLADVTYEGEALHPAPSYGPPAPAPYSAPAPAAPEYP